MKSAFWTKGYKGHWIHRHIENGREVIRWMPDNDRRCRPASSLHAAKLAITRYIREQS